MSQNFFYLLREYGLDHLCIKTNWVILFIILFVVDMSHFSKHETSTADLKKSTDFVLLKTIEIFNTQKFIRSKNIISSLIPMKGKK